MKTLQDFAQELRDAFERRERNNGDKFVCLKDGSPEWMKLVIREAHDDMFPDDWRYSMIEEAATALAEDGDPDDVNLEADIYTHELTGWLHSRADRYSFCDEALNEYGCKFENTITLLQMGQDYEKSQVLGLVRLALEKLVEAQEDQDTE